MNYILHLIPDEKSTEDVIRSCDEVSEYNIFVIYLINRQDIKFLTRIKANMFVKDKMLDVNVIIKNFSVRSVIIHGLREEYIHDILNFDHNLTLAWIVWGFDIYNLPRIKPRLLGKATGRTILRNHKKLLILQYIYKYGGIRLLYSKLFNKRNSFDGIFKVIERVTYFCTFIYGDYELFLKHYPVYNLSFQFIAFTSINQYLGSHNISYELNSSNILLGNSNDYTNNHLDAFNKLNESSLTLKEYKLIVPLNYGNDTKYKQIVLKRGHELFGEAFSPITNFLSRDAYLSIIKECSVGIFYHYRQQAMGNIIAMLYFGARIYLSNKNPVFEFLKSNGIYVYDFDHEFNIYFNKPLDTKLIVHNRFRLDQIFARKKIHSYIERLFEVLNNTSC